ncbi:conserved protein of unknown function [Alteromonas macleodii]|uniref:Uncharacterized protein n=1 Tax=Alteromonas macleodii TaxID=28108 RepID=A0A6T9XV42_ALTMA|nr:conserved protein of unknown function [Alteromonas macleodii]
MKSCFELTRAVNKTLSVMSQKNFEGQISYSVWLVSDSIEETTSIFPLILYEEKNRTMT